MYTRERDGSRRRTEESIGEVAQRRKGEEPFGKLRGKYAASFGAGRAKIGSPPLR
jgi:hypothetical protein